MKTFKKTLWPLKNLSYSSFLISRDTFRLQLCLYMSMCACGHGAHSCLTLFDPVDYSPPGSSVHGILQARTLECVAISFSMGFFLTQGSNPHLLWLLHWQAGSLALSHLGSNYVCNLHLSLK